MTDQKPRIDLPPRNGCLIWPECGCDLDRHECADAAPGDTVPVEMVVAVCACAVAAMGVLIWGAWR